VHKECCSHCDDADLSKLKNVDRFVQNMDVDIAARDILIKHW
jgi:hypothetical protein